VSRPRVEINGDLAWYAVWTGPRQERRVETALHELGFTTYAPTMASVRARGGSGVPIEAFGVGRYLFVGMGPVEPPYGLVRDQQGVLDFVKAGGEPLRVPAAAIQAYADELASHVVILHGGAFSRLMAIMSEADDVRARERGPFWTEAA